MYIYIYFCSHNILCYNHCNYFNFYNFLPCIKCSARASVIPCLVHLKIVRYFSKFGIVSRLNLYVIACINSTELANEFTTEDDR